MFRVSIQSRFSATHRLRLPNGELEPLHGHDWRVEAHFAREKLDDLGMVIDFELATRHLQEVLEDLNYRDLNAHPSFARVNPTAENVARHIYETVRTRGLAGIERVSVTEAPGCVATYTADD